MPAPDLVAEQLPAGAAIMRGAFRGFGVLLIGALLQPIVGTLLPPLGAIWLVLVAVVAFVSAAWIATTPDGGARSGVCAALGAYGFMLPIVLMGAGGRVDIIQVVATSATACLVGVTTTYLRLRRAAH